MLKATTVFFVMFVCNTSFAAETDKCQNITCSDHGMCVIKNDEPVCACDDGYQPDSTVGLSCVPLNIQNDKRTDSELQSVQRIVKKGDLQISFEQFKKNNPNRLYAEYWFERYDRRKKIGIGVMLGGLAIIGTGIILINKIEWAQEPGIIFISAGGVTTLLGLALFARGVNRTKRLDRLLLQSSFKEDKKLLFAGVGFWSNNGRNSKGMNLSLRF